MTEWQLQRKTTWGESAGGEGRGYPPNQLHSWVSSSSLAPWGRLRKNSTRDGSSDSFGLGGRWGWARVATPRNRRGRPVLRTLKISRVGPGRFSGTEFAEEGQVGRTVWDRCRPSHRASASYPLCQGPQVVQVRIHPVAWGEKRQSPLGWCRST